jgi:ribonuclease D
VLLDPATYRVEPGEAWLRVKTRTNSGRFLAVVKELARFREGYAQSRDVPRSRVYKDDALLELASTKPANMQDLSRSRLLLREARRGEIAEGILAAVKAGLEMPADDVPKPPVNGREKLQVNPALADLLRVLLKARSEDTRVAQRLIASAADLDFRAAGRRDVPALNGWRAEVFGADAIRLCDGKLALAAKGQSVRVIEV